MPRRSDPGLLTNETVSNRSDQPRTADRCHAFRGQSQVLPSSDNAECSQWRRRPPCNGSEGPTEPCRAILQTDLRPRPPRSGCGAGAADRILFSGHQVPLQASWRVALRSRAGEDRRVRILVASLCRAEIRWPSYWRWSPGTLAEQCLTAHLDARRSTAPSGPSDSRDIQLFGGIGGTHMRDFAHRYV